MTNVLVTFIIFVLFPGLILPPPAPVASRLARLSPDATALLRAAATLGDRTELSLAAALADLEPGLALSAAGYLVRADLLAQDLIKRLP